jgi:hypothetical protein
MELRHKFDLNLLLNQTNMARSNFYYHQKKVKSADKHQVIKELIKSIFHKHKGRYRYKLITDELNSKAIIINHKPFVLRLMKLLGLKTLIRVKNMFIIK